jgi:hypothetical protein
MVASRPNSPKTQPPSRKFSTHAGTSSRSDWFTASACSADWVMTSTPAKSLQIIKQLQRQIVRLFCAGHNPFD